jgi:hypothetical protein
VYVNCIKRILLLSNMCEADNCVYETDPRRSSMYTVCVIISRFTFVAKSSWK